MIGYDNWDHKRWPNFKPSEFACKCCKDVRMDEDILDAVQAVRDYLKKPIKVTSGYRCPDHNEAVSSTGRTGPHTTGCAVDIAVTHADAFKVLEAAFENVHVTGIGVNQKGAGRFIHLDTLPNEPGQPRPTVWSY